MISEKEAINLLMKYAKTSKDFSIVLQHSQAVKEASLKIANKILNNGIKVDLDLIKVGALLHDIGRLKCFGKENCAIQHGLIGYKIIKKEINDDRIANICAHHIGSGILKEEIILLDLPLPKEDYIPETLEEKIITYADNLAFGSTIKTFDDVLRRFINQLSIFSFGRFVKLHNEIKEKTRENEDIIDNRKFSIEWLKKYIDEEKQSKTLTKIFNKIINKTDVFKTIIKSFIYEFMEKKTLIIIERDENYHIKLEFSKNNNKRNICFYIKRHNEKSFPKNAMIIFSSKGEIFNFLYNFDDFLKENTIL